MAHRTERVTLDVTYDPAVLPPPSEWPWEQGLVLEAGTARLATIFGRPGRLSPALRDELATAREDLGRMTTRAVTAEAEVERLSALLRERGD